jgi:hypothetical protein
MGKLNTHWTSASTDDFLYRVAADFAQQIEDAMKESEASQAALAKALGVSEGRVSQVLNNPGNLTLRNAIEYARALKRKAAIVVYDDRDPKNRNGPINSKIFTSCWEMRGRPSDFFELNAPPQQTAISTQAFFACHHGSFIGPLVANNALSFWPGTSLPWPISPGFTSSNQTSTGTLIASGELVWQSQPK